MNNNIKSATTAGLLGIFLGAFGAHNWYLGEKKKGIIHVAMAGGGILLYVVADMMLPAILSWRAFYAVSWLVLLMNLVASAVMSASGFWGFIEGVMILSKGDAGLAQKGYVVAGPNIGYGQMQGYANGAQGMARGNMMGNVYTGVPQDGGANVGNMSQPGGSQVMGGSQAGGMSQAGGSQAVNFDANRSGENGGVNGQ